MKQMRFICGAVVLLAFISGVVSVRAEEGCKAVDHSQSPCLPKYKNQSDTSFCYAFAAAEIASFEFCEEVSPVALGLLKAEKENREKWSHDGGFPDEAIALGNENGFCREKDLPSAVTKDLPLGVARAYRDLLNDQRPPAKCTLGRPQPDVADLFPQTHLLDVLKFMSKDQKKMADLLSLAKANCKDKIQKKIELEQCHGDAAAKLKYVQDKVATEPVALAVVREPGIPHWIAGHATTIIGRERDPQTGECQFVVRDSGAGYRSGGLVLGDTKPLVHKISDAEMLKALGGKQSFCYSVKH